MKVGIINVTGYTGVELARLLHQHPDVELASVTGRSAAGKKLAEVFPHLADIDLTIEAELGEVELAFSAMPHKDSAAEVIPLLEKEVRVVDISADFRLKDATLYEKWYGFKHPSPQLLARAVYGLPELHRARIASARLVANPGCYPTSAILALAPAARAKLIGPDIVIDSKSGLSGSGRSLKLESHYAEVNEDTSAYALGGHRHMPEIAQELKEIKPSISFVPHLVPMTRGILSTCYATLAKKTDEAEVRQIYKDFYKDEPFVRVSDAPPHTKHTWGSNMCLVYPVIDPRTNRLIVIGCIDNLMKGAASQAVQNMNLMLGLPETAGIESLAIYP
ncbi:MAG: N-acetyl-gamma-glutamyl-phosphate reductase [Dehalococcoidia bacterium]|jgi:N-acetyl-gamma-glutamyl-phosphate reductase